MTKVFRSILSKVRNWQALLNQALPVYKNYSRDSNKANWSGASYHAVGVGQSLVVSIYPEGIWVNSRGRAFRDVHGVNKKVLLTLKGSNTGPDCDPFRVKITIYRSSPWTSRNARPRLL